MEIGLIKYLILPKGMQSILFKSYVYFLPFLYSLIIELGYLQKFLPFLLIFGLFEFVINPSRYQLNDLMDYEGDQQRKHHWQRPVTKDNKSLVLIVVLSRFTLGTSIAFLLDIRLGYLAIAFLALQLFYDNFAKKCSPLLVIITVSIAYPLRSLTIFYGLDITLDRTGLFLLLSILLYSAYMVSQWRKNESLFIIKNKLTPKPHAEFFSSPKINFLIFLILLAFLSVFISLIILLARVGPDDALIIYLTSLFLIITLSLPYRGIINKITAQSHNIIIAFLFIVLTLDKFLIAFAIAIFSILVIFWYHEIYVEKFASNYFNETHYDKT